MIGAVDALGNSTLTRYDDAGNRTLTTQANGLQDITQYDRAGRLVAHMQADTAGAVLGNTRYDYDADGRLRRSTDATGVQHWKLYDATGRLTGEIDGDGSLTEYVYNADDVLLQTIRYANRIARGRRYRGLTSTSCPSSDRQPAARTCAPGAWSTMPTVLSRKSMALAP